MIAFIFLLFCRPLTEPPVSAEYALLTRSFGGTHAAVQIPAKLPIGAVLVSRNLDEAENTSPGYWNHLAIHVGMNSVVESQADKGVIKTKLSVYSSRPYAPILVLSPLDAKIGAQAAGKSVV